VCEIPTAGAFGDLVWSDPEEIENWCLGSRGVGWLFGSRVVNEFNEHNWLKLIVRSHQLVEKGWQEWFKGKLVTVWSAPNYCYRCANAAAVMRVGEDGSWRYETFREDPRSI
jgi:diadenosine tetraphosphatase ApaH/serine/threonine PP2A family protein phosphatase